MTEVDFYILQETTLAARDHFVCRLAEKALLTGRHVVIKVHDEEHAESMSQYLWSFKPESFVPHALNNHTPNSDSHPAESIIIDWQGNTNAHYDVIINAQTIVPKEFSRFNKLMEVVVQDEDLLTTTRENYQFYRDRGYPLKSHKL
ncbi:DNA polymerase III subunit chi [Eionea flava]